MTTNDHTEEVDHEGDLRATSEGDLRTTSEGDTGVTWVTLRDASNATGVSISALRKWRKRDELESRMAPGPTGERVEVPMDAVLDLAVKRGAGTVPAAPVAAVATPEPEPATVTEPSAPVREGYELVPMETLERLLNIAATYGEAGERVGRAEATAETLRERLDETRNELGAERHRREQAEAELARLHGFDPTIPQPATGGAKPEEPAEVRREAPTSTKDTGRVTLWERLKQWRPGGRR